MTGEPRCAVGVPTVGPFGDPLLLVELAVTAEEHGWDGFFIWDHLLYHDPSWNVADPVVVIAAVAARTTRIRMGILVNALARRRAGKVARESVTLDLLSGGRLVVGAGLGSLADEFTAFGESAEARQRAARLDESLGLLDALWSGEPVTARGQYLTAVDVQMLPRPVQRPRIPVWCGGRWPNKAPFRRAARWDGVMPTHVGYGLGETMPPEELSAVVAYTREHRTGDGPFDVALEGRTDGAAPDRGAGQVTPYLAAGLTWWIEALGWWRGDPMDAMTRVRQGPPALDLRWRNEDTVGRGTREVLTCSRSGGTSISADGHEHVALTAVVTVATEVDVTTVSQLRAALVTACSTCPTVVVDMSQTAFCDSSGLTALIQARQRTRANGGELRLVITTPQVLSTFTVTGADRMFPVFASLRDALAAGPVPRPPARDLASSAAIQKGTPRWEILQDALEAARLEQAAEATEAEEARSGSQEISGWIELGHSHPEVMRHSAFARVQAQLESLPVIEQAKGILMAQRRCGPDEAFDLIRRASQLANIKVRVLAAEIVGHVASATAKPTRPPASNHR